MRLKNTYNLIEEKQKKINNDIREESHSYNEKIIDEVSSVKNIKYDDIANGPGVRTS